MSTKKNPEFRIVPVIACLITMLCVGIEYMWSVFQKPALEYFGWQDTAVTMISSAMIFMFVAGIFIGGLIIDRMGPRLVVLIGGLLFFAGLMLTSLLPQNMPEERSWLIYVTYGVLAGSGVGFAYSGAINCVQKWLPHRRGFATGICVCAFGLSIVIFAPVAEYFLKTGVPFTFRMFAIILGAIVVVMSFFFKSPPEGYAARLGVKVVQDKGSYSLGEALRDPRFWFMCSALFFGTAANMMINPRVKTLALLRDVPDLQTSITVQLVGVSSALSRLILPTLSDKISRSKTIFAMMIVMMVASFLMRFADGILYTVAVFFIVFAYSGPAGIYPAMAGDAYGMKNMSSIFGLAFLCIGLSSITFGTWLPKLLSSGAAAAADYNYKLIFLVGALTNLIPMVCMLIYDKVGKKKAEQRAALHTT
jgi:OFA family oxalate/formate antiporter-like MFS transporter